MHFVYFGSGAFGIPTFEALCERHEIQLVITQPDRPAGRHRALTPTPIAEAAAARNLPILKPENVNAPEVVQQIRDLHADALIVIAFGQKLGSALLAEQFAINLHGSLLPKYRGAAPIQRALMEGERETGVSVIGLTDRMDAGPILGQAATPIDPLETAGELHDRLALLGPDAVLDVLDRHSGGRLIPQYQDERLTCRAPKLTKHEGTTRFNLPADAVRSRVHGLTPWPGCTVKLDGRQLRLHRVQVAQENGSHEVPGMVLADHTIACSPGSIRVLEVQPPGGKLMSFDAYRNGQPVLSGMKVEPL